MASRRAYLISAGILAALLLLGQVIAFVSAPESWRDFTGRLPVILSMVFYWGPICAILSTIIVSVILHLMGFTSWEEIRRESVDENNPTPAIIFTGSLIASLLFLLLVIRP